MSIMADSAQQKNKWPAQNSSSYSKLAMTASESLFLLEAEIGKVNSGKIGGNVADFTC